jgi:hypothetical protein
LQCTHPGTGSGFGSVTRPSGLGLTRCPARTQMSPLMSPWKVHSLSGKARVLSNCPPSARLPLPLTSPDPQLAGSFYPPPQDTPTTSTNLSTSHTESADVSVIGNPAKCRIDKQTEDTDTSSVSASLSPSVEVLRGAWASSSIKVLCGFTQYN